MFTPTISREHRRQASDLRTRLAKALEPVTIADSPKLAPLLARREELRQEIAGIERGAGDGKLEELAQLLSNRRAQQDLTELQIKELTGARERADALAQKQSAETLDALRAEVVDLLAEISTSFQAQHRDALESAIGQYAVRHAAEASNVIKLIPWFLYYLRRIRAFREGGAEPDRLLLLLGLALENKDFLLMSQS